MSSDCILVVTRNRVDALVDSLVSLTRLHGSHDFLVVIQDNSDVRLDRSILRYFEDRLRLVYCKADDVLPMAENWDHGMQNCINAGASAVTILADRRLATKHLLKAFKILRKQNAQIVVFDHQSTWLSNETLELGEEYTFGTFPISLSLIKRATFDCYFDGYTPRLFNCVTSVDFLIRLKQEKGSYVGGTSPDINYQSRLASLDSFEPKLIGFSAPCIVTNRRHVYASSGMTKLSKDSVPEFHRISKPRYYPPELHGLIVATCMAEVQAEQNEPIVGLINWDSFFLHAVRELSFQTCKGTFDDIQERLISFVRRKEINGLEVKKTLQAIANTRFNNQKTLEKRFINANPPKLSLLSEVMG